MQKLWSHFSHHQVHAQNTLQGIPEKKRKRLWVCQLSAISISWNELSTCRTGLIDLRLSRLSSIRFKCIKTIRSLVFFSRAQSLYSVSDITTVSYLWELAIFTFPKSNQPQNHDVGKVTWESFYLYHRATKLVTTTIGILTKRMTAFLTKAAVHILSFRE